MIGQLKAVLRGSLFAFLTSLPSPLVKDDQSYYMSGLNYVKNSAGQPHNSLQMLTFVFDYHSAKSFLFILLRREYGGVFTHSSQSSY
jgi:hypothetical protein